MNYKNKDILHKVKNIPVILYLVAGGVTVTDD
jgi:hypothetical protein